MDLSKKLILCFSWLIVLYSIAILIFTKGFLLTRFVMRNNSTCSVNISQLSSPAGDGCWMPPSHKKAVIVIIDALRFDFVSYDESLVDSSLLPYQNKLKTLNELLTDKPHNSRLYRFMADPPTTTLQRLKGMTTGSLPTFIDVASNFDSSAISEDNIIDQLMKQNKKMVFMGDDTWTNLFPGRFMRSYPFPSFNVKDLHTVDNGVIEHLEPELRRDDWDVLIAHFLGVDHCGHRYGPNHPAMAEKLTQMDAVLKSVVEQLDDDTVLFVLGDHGMTRTGDHGGDSWDELQAALFVYTTTNIPHAKKGEIVTVAQTDFVPTLSLMLGIPIPFSNLGSVISDLFPAPDSQVTDHRDQNIALRYNAHQVRRFIEAYSTMSDEFPPRILHHLERKFTVAETNFKTMDSSNNTALQDVGSFYKDYLKEVRDMCQQVWAKFDLSLMTLGIVLVTATLAHSIYWAVSFSPDKTFRWQPVVIGVVASFWTMSLISLLAFVPLTLTDTVISLIIGCTLIVIFGAIAVKLTTDKDDKIDFPFSLEYIDVAHAAPLVVAGAYLASLFSNSYIVYEDAVSAYFLQTLVAYNGYRIVSKLYELPKKSVQHTSSRKTKPAVFDVVRYLTSPIALTMMLVLLTNSFIRLSSNFRACREEQWTCEPVSWLQSLASLTDDMTRYMKARYFLSVACVVISVYAVYQWLRFCGNLNGVMPCVLCVRFVLPTGAVCLSLYWALGGLPREVYDNLPVWQLTGFARIVYATVLLMLLCAAWDPLCLFVVARSDAPLPLTSPSHDNFRSQMFQHLKENWRRHLQGSSTAKKTTNEKPPLVYGLATVYSGSQLVLLSAVLLLLYMLLGDGLAPSLLLGVTIIVCLLELNAALVDVHHTKSLLTPWTSVLCWWLLASEHFYSTGHQTVVTSIQWQAAFHGFHGDFQYYVVPIMLILTNTFTSYILVVLSLPLLLYWPRVRQGIVFVFEASRKGMEGVKDTRGEFVLHEHRDKLWSALFSLFTTFIILQGLKVLATMCCAMIHRRHLMVWKIFAPRFLFEGATFLLVGPLCIVVYLFVIRVDSAIQKWIKKLET